MLKGAAPTSKREQRKRKWLVFAPAYVMGLVTGNVLVHRLSEPLNWVIAGVVGIMVYLGAYRVLEAVVARRTTLGRSTG